MTDSERKDYYEILGVEPNTSIKLVKNAYLQLMHKLRAEGDESPEAQERIKLIEEAYEVLTDPQKRVDYDSPGQIYAPETGHESQQTSKSTYLQQRRTQSQSQKTPPSQGIDPKIWISIIIGLLIVGGVVAVFQFDLFGDDEVDAEPILDIPTPVVTVDEPTPPDMESYFKSGKEFLAQGYFEKAIEEFTQAIALGKNDIEVYTCRGDAYFGDGQHELAIDDYTIGLDIDPKSAENWKKRALAYDEIGEFKLAISDYSTAIELNAKDPDAYYNRGYRYFSSIKVMDPSTYESGYANLALTDFDTAIALNPSNATYHYSRGLVHNLHRLYDAALVDFTQAILLDPTYSDAYIERGAIRLSMEQYSSAVDDYDKIIALDPEFIDAYNWRGHAYYLLGLYDFAIADLSMVLEHNATVYVQSERGFCYLKKHDLTKAILDFDMCTIYYPAFPDAWFGRAQAYHLLGDNIKAIDDMEKYIALVLHDAGLVGQARQFISNWKKEI